MCKRHITNSIIEALPNTSVVLVLMLAFMVQAYPSMTFAQSFPGSADVSRFKERIEIPSVANRPVVPDEQMQISPQIPEASDGFILEGIDLTGLTVFEEQGLQELIREYIDRPVDLNVLNHFTARVTMKYRNSGYLLSKAVIPAQEVEDGVVRVDIIEGYINRVVIDDPLGLLDKDIFNITLEAIEKITAMDPLHGPTMERYILLLNDHAGVRIQSIMTAAPDIKKPGGIDITLKVLKKSGEILLNYNNHGSKFIGPHQAEVSYLMGGILSAYDTLSVQASTTIPMDEIKYGAINYGIPLSANGLLFNTSFSYADSHPGGALQLLDVEGDSFSWEGGLTYTLTRSRRIDFDISALLSVRNSSTEFLDEELIDDKIRSVILTSSYNHQSELGHISNTTLSLHKGLDIWGATTTGSDNLSRTQGRSDFFKIAGSFVRIQRIPRDFYVVGQIEGQYAPHPLLSSEEFGYGGATIGRAYDYSEITGDQGLAASLEARYTGLDSFNDVITLTPFAYYDIGKTWDHDTGGKPTSAASAGFGTYYQVDDIFSGSAIAAFPLTKDIDTPIMNGNDGPRLLMELNARF